MKIEGHKRLVNIETNKIVLVTWSREDKATAIMKAINTCRFPIVEGKYRIDVLGRIDEGKAFWIKGRRAFGISKNPHFEQGFEGGSCSM